MSDIQLATKRLIDAVWTVAYIVGDDGRVTIHGHSRWCNAGYAYEKQLPRFSMIEEPEGRIVQKLVLAPYEPFSIGAKNHPEAQTFEVANPKNVFSYGEVPEAKGEQS